MRVAQRMDTIGRASSIRCPTRRSCTQHVAVNAVCSACEECSIHRFQSPSGPVPKDLLTTSTMLPALLCGGTTGARTSPFSSASRASCSPRTLNASQRVYTVDRPENVHVIVTPFGPCQFGDRDLRHAICRAPRFQHARASDTLWPQRTQAAVG